MFFGQINFIFAENTVVMSETKLFKYLISTEQDKAWGMTVNSVGMQKIVPFYDSYPPPDILMNFILTREKGGFSTAISFCI